MTALSEDQRTETRGDEAPPPGMLEYAARVAFRDLARLHGRDEARQIMAEIINDEYERKTRQ
jgi:hypothetical protein